MCHHYYVLALLTEDLKDFKVNLRVGEKDAPGTGALLDAFDSVGLFLLTWVSRTVRGTCARPASLQVVSSLAFAALLEQNELLLDEITGTRWGHVGVEVGVDIGTEDINDVTDSTLEGSVLPDV